jgi:hypothetical protein
MKSETKEEISAASENTDIFTASSIYEEEREHLNTINRITISTNNLHEEKSNKFQKPFSISENKINQINPLTLSSPSNRIQKMLNILI